MISLNKYLIPLYSSVYITKVREKHLQISKEDENVLRKEISALGYSITGLNNVFKSQFAGIRKTLLDDLESFATIPNVNVLFNKFPYSTPDPFSYNIDRILGYIQNKFPDIKGKFLSCGHVIDESIFNLDDFGACPICQFQVNELSTPNHSNLKFECVSPLKPLYVVGVDDIIEFGNKLISRQSSLSDMEKEFLVELWSYGIDLKLPEKCFKETLPFLYKHTRNVDYVKNQLSGATDVMRLAYYMSDSNADLSLKDNVKFSFKGADARNFMRMLESLSNLEEDFMRNRERWLRFGEIIHVGSQKNRNKYPNVAKAFDAIRNNPKGIATFNRKVERAVENSNFSQLLELLKTRPGEFIRRLDFLIRELAARDGGNEEFFDKFATVCESVPTRTLFEVAAHLKSRNEKEDSRIFFIKGNTNKFFIRPENRPIIKSKNINRVRSAIFQELMRRFENDEAEKTRVFIDPALKNVIVPFNRRGDSNKSENILSKGSRIPFTGDVIRLYVWWKGDVDVDLSAAFYDENWETKGLVAYTNLSQGGYAKHSGDIQYAPNGATEFIDINIKDCIDDYRGARYVVSNIISYSGQPFNTFECCAGFMERDSLTSGALFEPLANKTKVEINRNTRCLMAFAFDLVTKEVVLIDMNVKAGRYSNMVSMTDKTKTLAKHIVNLPKKKPSFYDVLFTYHITNNYIVTQSEYEENGADIVFDLNTDVQAVYDILDIGPKT